MTDTPQLLLAHHLKALKLPTFLREYDKLARQCAAEGLDHIRFLLRLAELELIERERRMVERRIKEAKFPAVKSLDSFDFAAIPSLNKTLVLELARSEYVTRRENIIAVGNSGTGKTHIGLGLGLAACQKGLSVGFNIAAALVHELLEARDEKRLLRLQRQLAGYKLLIIDELGYVPLSQTGAELLFEVFNDLGDVGGQLAAEIVSERSIITSPIAYPVGNDAFVAFQASGTHCPGPSRDRGITVLRISSGSPPTINTAWCASFSGRGSPIATTTDGHSNPIVWILGAEGDNRLHAFRGDTGEPLYASEPLSGLRHFQTLIAIQDRLYVAADGRIYAFRF